MTDNSLQNISSDTSANISNKIISDTVSNATSMNKESAQNVYNDSIAVHPSEKIVQAPLNKDTVINQSQISKTNDSSLYARVKVKEGDIETFNTFLKKQYPSKYESYIANPQLLSYSVIETVKRSWNQYLNGINNPILSNKNQISENKTNSEVIATHESHRNDIDNTSKEFVYYIQIAACRKKVSTYELKKYFHINDSISTFYDDNWYKYAIGRFHSYKDAIAFKNNINIQGAFVIAYLNGNIIKITPSFIKRNVE